MIGKIQRGSSFKGVCQYLLNPDKEVKPEIIAGNMSGTTPQALASEFEIFAALNQRVKITVKHFSLSFAPEDGEVSDDLKCTLANDYIDRMGYGNSQYLVVNHSRQDHNHNHDHLHIVANAVAMDGKWVDDWLNWKQSQCVLRNLEREYELTPVISSWDKNRDKFATTRVDRREQRLLASGVQPAEIERIHNSIQAKINLAGSAPTISQFCVRLQSLGVETIPRITRTGRVRGFSYKLGEVVTKGSDLENASFPSLQSVRGIGYDIDRDLVNLRSIARGEKLEIKPDEQWEIETASNQLDNSEVRVRIKVENDRSSEQQERGYDRGR